jgi:hypothetical protein
MLHPGITDMRFKDCDDKVFAETWIAPPPWKVGMVVARAKDGTMSMSGGEHVIISNSELVKGEEVMRLLKHLAMLVKMVTELFVFRHENPGCSGELPEKYFEPSFGK